MKTRETRENWCSKRMDRVRIRVLVDCDSHVVDGGESSATTADLVSRFASVRIRAGD